MTSLVPKTADEFIEQQLNARLEAVEGAFGADGLSVIGPLVPGVDDLIRLVVEAMRQGQRNRSSLVCMLTTNGGQIETVQRVVETFRHCYDHVSFVVLNYAYSAGTVLAMSGDEIYMDYYGRLGPIDPQMMNANGRWVPALGYLKQWERLMERAKSGDITLPEVQLMIEGFDQAELYQYEQARELSVTLLKEWLVKYKFKNWTETETRKLPVDDAKRQQRAEEIARELNNTDRWHSHGSGISMAVLDRHLNLKVTDIEQQPERYAKLKEYEALLTDYVQKRGHRGVLHALDTYVPFLGLQEVL